MEWLKYWLSSGAMVGEDDEINDVDGGSEYFPRERCSCNYEDIVDFPSDWDSAASSQVFNGVGSQGEFMTGFQPVNSISKKTQRNRERKMRYRERKALKNFSSSEKNFGAVHEDVNADMVHADVNLRLDERLIFEYSQVSESENLEERFVSDAEMASAMASGDWSAIEKKISVYLENSREKDVHISVGVG